MSGREWPPARTSATSLCAYERQFSSVLCNRASVDLEPLEDPVDMRTVRNLIEKHVEATGSPRGQWILEKWGEMVLKFVKIFPHEYKRVLGIPKFVPRPVAHIASPAERQEAAHG